MKGNKFITLLLIITTLTVLTEIESRVKDYYESVYNRFITDLKLEDQIEKPVNVVDIKPMLTILKTK